jgi:hypothetical protein
LADNLEMEGTGVTMGCTEHFDELIQFEVVIGPQPGFLPNLLWLLESGKMGDTVHRVTNQLPQWHQLCALEDDLIKNRANKGFKFVVGEHANHLDVRGWLLHEGGTVVVPLGPLGQQTGSDILIADAYDWAGRATVYAIADAEDASGISINRQLKDRGMTSEQMFL